MLAHNPHAHSTPMKAALTQADVVKNYGSTGSLSHFGFYCGKLFFLAKLFIFSTRCECEHQHTEWDIRSRRRTRYNRLRI